MQPEYETLLVAGTKLDDEESSDYIFRKTWHQQQAGERNEKEKLTYHQTGRLTMK